MARPPFLFGGNSSAATQSKYLVEFKAGKMTQKGSTVFPVKKKGSVYVHQSDDSLMHFCWKDRTTGQTEDDLIIFPDDAEFKRVPACTTGRVYVLKFKSSNRRCFYWMQEAKDDKDDEFATKINEYLNNPPPAGSRGSSGGSGGLGHGLADLGSLPDADLQNLLNNMNPQQLMQMLGGVGGTSSLAGLLGSGGSSTGGRTRNAAGNNSSSTAATATAASPARTTTTTTTQAERPSTTAAAAPAASGASPAIQLSDLQSIISGLTVPETHQQPGASGRDQVNVDLSSSINYEALQPLLSNEDFMRRVKEHLPPSVDAAGQPAPVAPHEVPRQLQATVSSPQFQQALSIFCAALQSGQLAPLIQQFGLSPACVVAAQEGNLEKFVKALQESEQKKKDEKKKEDDAMALD